MSNNVYQSTQKKVVQQTMAIDYDTGEIKKETNVLRLPQEPAFIKLYLDDILYYHDMPRGLNPILQIFLRNMNWENRLILNGSLKKRMAESIRLSVASIDKAITQLVKGNVLIREEKGIYLFNPYLFGKGSWEAIQEIRLNITYNLNGRTFSSKIKTEDSENGDSNNTESSAEQFAAVSAE